MVSAVFFSIHFVAGLFTTSPEDVAAVQNDRFMKVWEGTSEEPVIEHADVTGNAAQAPGAVRGCNPS